MNINNREFPPSEGELECFNLFIIEILTVPWCLFSQRNSFKPRIVNFLLISRRTSPTSQLRQTKFDSLEIFSSELEEGRSDGPPGFQEPGNKTFVAEVGTLDPY